MGSYRDLEQGREGVHTGSAWNRVSGQHGEEGICVRYDVVCAGRAQQGE